MTTWKMTLFFKGHIEQPTKIKHTDSKDCFTHSFVPSTQKCLANSTSPHRTSQNDWIWVMQVYREMVLARNIYSRITLTCSFTSWNSTVQTKKTKEQGNVHQAPRVGCGRSGGKSWMHCPSGSDPWSSCQVNTTSKCDSRIQGF